MSGALEISPGNWAMTAGAICRGLARRRDDCPYPPRSALARCWRWGWAARDRARVRRDGAIDTRETLPRPRRSDHPWTRGDLAVLVQCGADVADRDIAAMLDRSRQSITGKRHRMRKSQPARRDGDGIESGSGTVCKPKHTVPEPGRGARPPRTREEPAS